MNATLDQAEAVVRTAPTCCEHVLRWDGFTLTRCVALATPGSPYCCVHAAFASHDDGDDWDDDDEEDVIDTMVQTPWRIRLRRAAAHLHNGIDSNYPLCCVLFFTCVWSPLLFHSPAWVREPLAPVRKWWGSRHGPHACIACPWHRVIAHWSAPKSESSPVVKVHHDLEIPW